MTNIKIIWLTPYPVQNLKNELEWTRYKASGHPCSWIVNLAKSLSALEGLDLHLITLCPGVKRDQSFFHPDGYTLHVLKSGIPFSHRGFPSWFPVNARFGFRQERRILLRRMDVLKPDLVHAHGTEHAYGLAAMDAGFPWLVSIQGIIADYLRTNPCLLFKLVTPLETRVLKRAKYIGGRTHYDKGYAEKMNPQATVLDLPEAMNELFYSDPWKDPVSHRILFVGSCQPRKGLHRLIEALGMISAHYPDMTLEAVGGGSSAQRANMLARAESAGVKLNFLGVKTAAEIAALHRECCCFIIPSENENSPNSLAEAMASGMPCVAYDTGGIASMMEHEVSGLLVPFGDAQGMAEAITKIFHSSELRQHLGFNARKQAESNHPAHVAEVTVNAYKRIVEEWGD